MPFTAFLKEFEQVHVCKAQDGYFHKAVQMRPSEEIGGEKVDPAKTDGLGA